MEKCLRWYNYSMNISIKNLNQMEEYNPKWIGPGHDNNFWTPGDDGYCITDSLINNMEKSSFTYKINSHGFRSQNFKKLDANKINILTSGCSQSFGYGLPEELRWQSFLLNNLSNKDVELFDISATGASFRLIVRNVFAFIKNYGKPDYIFIPFPDVARDFMFHEKYKRFVSVSANTKYLLEKRNNQINPNITYTESFNESDAIMRALESIWFLEDLCNALGIKLFWTTWVTNNSYVQSVFANCDFNNFIKPDLEYLKQLRTIENPNNLEYWHYAADGEHLGSSWTSWQGKIFSEKFYNG